MTNKRQLSDDGKTYYTFHLPGFKEGENMIEGYESYDALIALKLRRNNNVNTHP
jgi:hypothetical protein